MKQNPNINLITLITKVATIRTCIDPQDDKLNNPNQEVEKVRGSNIITQTINAKIMLACKPTNPKY